MILIKREVAYVKIPRTGGTTLNTALTGALKAAGEPYIDALDVNRQLGRRKHWGRHVAVTDLQEVFDDRFADLRFFTIVRQPLDRLISVFRWQRGKDVTNPVHASFEDFMLAVWRHDERLRPQARLHTRAQIRWLRDHDGNVPYDRLLIIPANRQEAFYPHVSELVGANVLPGPRVNVSGSAKDIYISDDIKDEVRRRYRADFQLWNKIKRAEPVGLS